MRLSACAHTQTDNPRASVHAHLGTRAPTHPRNTHRWQSTAAGFTPQCTGQPSSAHPVHVLACRPSHPPPPPQLPPPPLNAMPARRDRTAGNVSPVSRASTRTQRAAQRARRVQAATIRRRHRPRAARVILRPQWCLRWRWAATSPPAKSPPTSQRSFSAPLRPRSEWTRVSCASSPSPTRVAACWPSQ